MLDRLKIYVQGQKGAAINAQCGVTSEPKPIEEIFGHIKAMYPTLRFTELVGLSSGSLAAIGYPQKWHSTRERMNRNQTSKVWVIFQMRGEK